MEPDALSRSERRPRATNEPVGCGLEWMNSIHQPIKKAPPLSQDGAGYLLNRYRHDFVTLLNLINQVNVGGNFSEYRVMAIQMLGVIPVVADKKL